MNIHTALQYPNVQFLNDNGFPDNRSASSDMAAFFTQENSKDWELICQGGSVRSHSQILMLRSTFFANKHSFHHPELISRVEIEEFHVSVMSEFVEFMYTDMVKSRDNYIELIRAAFYFDVPKLRQVCESELVKSINRENVVELLNLTNEPQFSELDHLIANLVRFVMQTRDILNFPEGLTHESSITVIKAMRASTFFHAKPSPPPQPFSSMHAGSDDDEYYEYNGL